MIELKNNPAGNFFLLAGPCVIEGEEMAMRIAERVVGVTEKLQIPYVFKGSYRKANRSRLDSFTGIGDEKALKVLKKVHDTFGVPTVTDIHSADEAEMAAEYGVTGGMPQLIETVAKAGIAVGADGIFIETHENPAVAKSDGANMLKLDLLEGLLTKLVRIREAIK